MKTLHTRIIQTTLLATGLLLFNACGGGSKEKTPTVTPTPTAEEKAIEKIKAYASSDGGSTAPIMQDYIDAKVRGINDNNLADMNQVVENLSALEVDTKEELQELADALGVVLPTDTTPPMFTSDDNVTVDENQISAITLVATDINTVTYSISGADAVSFTVDASSGVVIFNIAADYESKNSYTFIATATDTASNTNTQTVTINIQDINETTVPVNTPKILVSFRNVPVITDGTIAGTKYLVDPYNTPNRMRAMTIPSSNVMSTYTIDNTILFFATDTVHGNELWKTDGSPERTEIVKDIKNGVTDSISSFLPQLQGIGDNAYFLALDSNGTKSVFKSDGTAAGTSPIFTQNRMVTAIGNMLYFAHKTDDEGNEPWISAGTDKGNIIKDISFFNPTIAGIAKSSSNPHSFTSYKSNVYFYASYIDELNNGITHYALFKTDGTEGGTRYILDVSGYAKMIECGGLLYFSGVQGKYEDLGYMGEELWRSDGTPSGTTTIDVLPGKGSSKPQYLTCVNDSIFFIAKGQNNYGLWKSNGTSDTTSFLKKIEGTSAMESVGNKLISISLTNIWVSDGTPNGTTKLDILSNGIHSLTPLTGNKVVIKSHDELWVTDGTLVGSKKLLSGK